MKGLIEFWKQPSAKYRNFQLAFTVLTLNFAIPTLSYVFAPEVTQEQFAALNEFLGGAPYTFPEAQSRFWRYLGAANVATLAFMCALLQWDLRRKFAVLTPLVFMKATAATLWLAGFIATPEYPAFLAAAILDYVTSGAFVFFAVRARRDIEDLDDDDLSPSPSPLRQVHHRTSSLVLRAMLPLDDAPRETVVRLERPGAMRLRLGFGLAVWAVSAAALATHGRTFGGLSEAEREAFVRRLGESSSWVARQLVEIVKTVACMGFVSRSDVRRRLGVPS
jgi:hypothetical protein